MTRSSRGAFTLIELLVVITIIALLSTIGLAVGYKVTRTGKISATQNVIRALDQVLEAYRSAKEGLPPAYVHTNLSEFIDTRNASGDNWCVLPMFDGRVGAQTAYDRDTNPPQPSTAIFLIEARKVPAADALIKGIDQRFLERRNMPIRGWNSTGAVTQFNSNQVVNVPVVIDAFGQPIRFCHPAFFGGAGDFFTKNVATTRDLFPLDPPSQGGLNYAATTGSRSCQPFAAGTKPNWVGDADEGIGIGKTAYFYSCGPDMDAGTRSDNVYTNQPTYPSETQALSSN